MSLTGLWPTAISSPIGNLQTELPVNNQTGGDRAADVTIRELSECGLIFRALEIPPDVKDAKKHIEIFRNSIRR
jgi:hypothetical protein